MKRVLIVLILFLSLSTFLTPFILADDRENNERNYFKKILDVLKDILAELKIISGKNETIIVEPNITVNPNITLPDEECEFEKLNQQKVNINVGIDNIGCCGYHNFTEIVHIPSELMYEDVDVVSGMVVAVDNSGGSSINVKGVNCFNVENTGLLVRDHREPLVSTFREQRIYKLPQSCIDAFVPGSNNLTISIPSNSGGFINEYYLEMKVKSVNC